MQRDILSCVVGLMNNRTVFKRLVVLREGKYPDRQLIILRGVDKIQVPFLDHDNYGFGVAIYRWDGRSTNVQGLPVFE